MKRDKVSIIIPVYNAAGYLDKCIESVLSQTHSDLDVIIVNDGSTDTSADVISKYLSDSRVVYIEQENAGVSAALNRGMDCASGEFITFIGNDDYLEPEMYEKMLHALKTEDADMSVCDFNLVYEDGRDKQAKYSKLKNETIDLKNDLYRYFTKCCVNPRSNNYVWSRLYKTEIIKKSKVRFEKLSIGEDTLFNFKLLAHTNKVVLIENGFYNYLQRAGSVVHNVAKKQALAKTYADQFDLIADYYKNNHCEQLIECLPVIAFTRMRSVFFYSRLSGMSNDEIVKSISDDFSGRQIADYLTGFYSNSKK